MTDTRKAMTQAIAALEEAVTYTSCPSWSPSMTDECNAAIESLKAALAQGEKREAVAWLKVRYEGGHESLETSYEGDASAFPVYTHPVPLTQGEKREAVAYHRLMQKEGEAWLPASEWLTGEPSAAFTNAAASCPDLWRIDYLLDGKKVADTFASAFTKTHPRIKELEGEVEEYKLASLIGDTMGELLEKTVNVLKGEPEPLHLHDWSNLPKIAAEMKAERDAALVDARRYQFLRKYLTSKDMPLLTGRGARPERDEVERVDEDVDDAMKGEQ